MSTTRRRLLASTSAVTFAGLHWQAFGHFTLENATASLYILVSPRIAETFVDAAQKVAGMPVHWITAPLTNVAVLARVLHQRRGADVIGLLNAAEHVFVNEALRLAGSRVLSSHALVPATGTDRAHTGPIAALTAGAAAVDHRAAGLMPLIAIA